jgi:hypothetical protein
VPVFTLDLFEHSPTGLIGVHVYRLGVTGGDRLLKRRQQVRDRHQRTRHTALGHVKAIGGQRLHDPVHR